MKLILSDTEFCSVPCIFMRVPLKSQCDMELYINCYCSEDAVFFLYIYTYHTLQTRPMTPQTPRWGYQGPTNGPGPKTGI